MVGVAALAAVALLAALFVARNQERKELDAETRARAGGRFVPLPDGMVHYDVAGPDSADVVVLVHGFSVPYYIWDTTFATLRSAGYRVVRYDLYGRGYSDRPRVAYDGALFTRQLDALLDSLRVTGRVHLVGLSMGGLVVAGYADAHPGRVQSVTLIDPAFSPHVQLPFPLGIPLVGEYVFAVASAPGMPESQLSDFLHPEDHPDWADRYRAQMHFVGFRRAILSTMRSSRERNDSATYTTLARTGLPALLIWGREDKTVPFEYSDSLRGLMPAAAFVPVDSARHLPHIEQPDVTHAALLGFLAAHRQGPP